MAPRYAPAANTTTSSLSQHQQMLAPTLNIMAAPIVRIPSNMMGAVMKNRTEEPKQVTDRKKRSRKAEEIERLMIH